MNNPMIWLIIALSTVAVTSFLQEQEIKAVKQQYETIMQIKIRDAQIETLQKANRTTVNVNQTNNGGLLNKQGLSNEKK